MPDFNITNTQKVVIDAIKTYEEDAKGDAASVTTKVAEFMKASEGHIQEKDLKKIKDLTGRLSDPTSKGSVCKELRELITSVAGAIQQPNAKQAETDPLAVGRQAFKKFIEVYKKGNKELTNKAAFTFLCDCDATQKERYRIIKDSIDKETIYAILENIQSFQLGRYELSLAEKIHPYYLAQHIDKFLELTPDDRLGLAMDASRKSPAQLVKYIKNFNIESEDDRYHLARDVGFSKDFSGNIKNFELTPEHEFIIAEIVAKSGGTIQNFRELGIKDEMKRLTIAYRITENNPHEIIKNIADFELSEEYRFNIAKHLAPALDYGYYIVESFSNFNLNDAHRLEIAEMLFKTYPMWPAKRLEYFNLKPEDRLRFAWISAQKYPQYVSDWIDKFDLQLSDRIAIARYAIIKEAVETIHYLNKYQFGEKEKHEILFHALKTSPENASNILQYFGPIPVNIPKEFEALNKQVTESENEGIRLWWTAFQLIINACPKEQYEEYAALAQLIFDFENPAARYIASVALLEHGLPSHKEKVKHKRLLSIILDPLLKQAQMSSAEMNEIWTVLSSKDYREASRKEKTVKGLYTLLDCSVLSSADKRALLNHIFTNNKTTPAYDALQMLEAIIVSGSAHMLKEPANKETDEKSVKAASGPQKEKLKSFDLEAILQQIFKEYTGTGAIADFGAKYSSTIGKSRNPIALLIYSANLEGMSKEASLHNALKAFSESVLNGTYAQLRYQAPPKSHLATVFEGRSQLKQEWQKGEAMSIGDLYKTLEQSQSKEAALKTDDKAKKPDPYDKFIVADTDAWDDMLLCGTEVSGSCMRLGSNVSSNKCLLGYIIDGKNRAIVIKDPVTGKIAARCIMRLLWDEISKKPVLFQERIYWNGGVSARARIAMHHMFERRAKQLGIDLVNAETITAVQPKVFPDYRHDISSLGSPAPYENVDAGEKGETNGIYTISAGYLQLIQAAQD